MNTDWLCDFCNKEQQTLYEGWFRAVPTNEWNVGTATASLIQQYRVCRACMQQAIENGRACAKEIINEDEA